MGDTTIQIEKLGKRYRIGRALGRNQTFREVLVDAACSPFRRMAGMFRSPGIATNSDQETIWALRNVSFDIRGGDTVGVIGRNGAGKSTLLKILSRITEPTTGRVRLRGRVGALLEIGTGFHSELTGEENVYLSGAILGMKHDEIRRKFDEIVAFAEVEKFIRTPVKHYSSGMYLRLAFAVAAHLDPEILLVDEVLAVGDVSFQKKCLGKMDAVAHEGRTVLFVSHNLGAVQRLCRSAVLLERGEVKAYGPAAEVSALYLKDGMTDALSWRRSAPAQSDIYFRSIYMRGDDGEPLSCVTTSDSVRVVLQFVVGRRCRDLQVSLGLLDRSGEQIFGTAPQDTGLTPPEEPGEYTAVVTLPAEILMAKTYGIRAALWVPGLGILDRQDGLQFSVQETASLCNSIPEGRHGQIAIRCEWKYERPDDEETRNGKHPAMAQPSMG
ncbi:MAG TPA: polysaccharide ABC transporter ATP-binding protein [Syntrophales bacterium]|nr:polysaccharide ABC transporter ATP-binding protein [Syntrophales bacterium]